MYGWSLLFQNTEVRDKMNTEKGEDTEPLDRHERLGPFGHRFSDFLSPKSFRAGTDAIYERR